MKKKSKIIIAIAASVCVIAVVIIAAVVVSVHSGGKKYNTHLELAQQYLEDMDYDRAIAELRMTIDIEPGRSEAYLVLADVYMEMGNYEEAVDVLEEGVEKTIDISEDGVAAAGRRKMEVRLEQVQIEYERLQKEIIPGPIPNPNIDTGSTGPKSEHNTTTSTEERSVAETKFFDRAGTQLTDNVWEIPFLKTCDEEGGTVFVTLYCGTDDNPKYVCLDMDNREESVLVYTTYDIYTDWVNKYKAWVLQNDSDYNPYYMYRVLYPRIMKADGTYAAKYMEYQGPSWRFERE